MERPFVTLLHSHDNCVGLAVSITDGIGLLRPYVASMFFDEWSAFIFSIESREMNRLKNLDESDTRGCGRSI